MPWKNENDPYKIWLSEIILQQTRVEQGWDYYNKFIKHYPTIQKLAKTNENEVFKLWEGLGYYNRCRNLITTAKYISEELNGEFPETYNEIIALKGVGPYTAAAIASFAYGLPFAVVDGNVTRVLSRFYGISTPIDSTAGKKEFELLYFLAQHPNKVFSREDLLHHIWGADVYVLARTVDVHVRKVREKIGDDYISTVKGVGYKFNEI